MIRLKTLLCCIGLICAEAPFNHNDRVIGGTEAEPHSWKYQASLQENLYDDGYWYHICGGTLIDAFHVMTAAHCVGPYASVYRVVLGEHDLYEDGGTEQIIAVEKVIIHPGWTGDLGNGNDIALLKLANGVYDNGFVAVANLPSVEETLPHKFTCYITGWGLLSSTPGGDAPVKLQVAPLNVIEHSICSQHEWWGSIALKSMVCAGGDGITAGCQGDSGGPLSCKKDSDAWRVHGVVSYGPSGMCNQVSKPTVFTRVSYFMDWIFDVTGRAQ